MRLFFHRSAKEQKTTTFATSIELGAFGEKQAVAYLQKQGYRIVATNFLAPIGRTPKGQQRKGEIDIIAYDDEGCLCFVEVKTRSSVQFAAPETAVDRRKQRQIIRTARVYRRLVGVMGELVRYDVVTVVHSAEGIEIRLLKNYFQEQRYERSKWFRESF